MSSEVVPQGPNIWHELAIEHFETVVDTNAFEKVIDQHHVEEKITGSFADLTVDVDSLPHEITESHYFPRQFNMQNFKGTFTQYAVEDAADEWQLSVDYSVNGQPYSLISDGRQAVLNTTGYEGNDLRFRFGPDTATHFLAAIAAIQLEVDQDKLAGFFERKDQLSIEQSIPELLRIIGTHDGTSRYERSRLAWLPLLDAYRTLVVNYEEIETSKHTGRKLSYNMAWQVTDYTTQIASHQTEFVGRGGSAPYFSQRSSADFAPEELLFLHQLGQTSNIGEMVDADTERDQHAYIANSLMVVLNPYLAKYAELDT